MKKSSLISILPQILLSHKEWFESKGKDGIFADLSGEDLRESNFKNAVLVEANLQGSDLRGANFENADLRGANLQDAQLQGACLKNANFEETDLMWADLAPTCKTPAWVGLIFKAPTCKTPASLICN